MNGLSFRYHAGVLHDRIVNTELHAAVWIDTHRRARLIPLAWIHRGLRPWVFILAGTVAVVEFRDDTASVVVAAALALALAAFSRVAAKSHRVLRWNNQTCPYCPTSITGTEAAS